MAASEDENDDYEESEVEDSQSEEEESGEEEGGLESLAPAVSLVVNVHVVRHRHCRRFPKDTPKPATRMLTMSALPTTS